jgi:hypothetical protein
MRCGDSGEVLCCAHTLILPTRSRFGFRSSRMSTASGILVRIHDLLSFIDSLAFRLCAQFRRISVRRSARISLTGNLKTQRHTPSTYVCQHSTTLPIPQPSLAPPDTYLFLARWGTRSVGPQNAVRPGAKVLTTQPASLPLVSGFASSAVPATGSPQ